MKILVVHCKYRISGGEDTAVKNDIRLLRDIGHEVLVYIKSNETLDKMSSPARLGVAIGYVCSPAARKKYRQLIEDRKPDVIWVHNTLWMIGTAIYEAALECGVPVIQTVHNFRLICPCGILYREDQKVKLTGERCGDKICRDCPERGLHNAIRNRCYRDNRILTAIIGAALIRQRRLGIYGRISFACLSELQRDILLDAGIGIDPGNVYIKHNHTYDEDVWIPYNERDNTFIYAGRLERNKGIEELLEAWRRLEKEVYINKDESCPVLTICGSGGLSEYVRKSIAAHDLHYVNYIGRIDSKKVAGHLSKAKALIYPTGMIEGQPMTIVEAYKSGTPVITTGMGNAGAMVEDGLTGRHIQTDDMINSIVNIIQKWDSDYTYNETALKEKAELYSSERAKATVDAILSDVVKWNHAQPVKECKNL